MRQERTGESATTPVAVGDPIGSIKNKGTKGGWFTTSADNRRPILRQTDGLYWFETDGVDDFLELDGLALDLAQLNMFTGIRVLTDTFSNGIITFQSSSNTDVNRDDGGFFAINGMGELVWRMGSPVMVTSIPGIMWKTPHVVELRNPGNDVTATTWVNNAPGNVSATATTLGPMAGKFLIGARQVGSEAVGRFGHLGYYSIVAADEVLTDVQRDLIRDYCYSKTRVEQPQYPKITNRSERDAARNRLIGEVFSGAGIPTAVATLAAESASAVHFDGVTGLAAFQKMTIPGYTLRPRMLTPAAGLRNDIAVLVWIGHSAGIWAYNVPTISQLLINMGVRVIVLPLPDSSIGDDTAGSPGDHETNHTPLKNWAGPASIVMNTLRADYPTMDFYMAGISGGGWATQFCAALDDRVIGSAQFVGSFPQFIYIPRDWEQRLPGVTASFLDMYLLAASNGWHNHVLYENDPAGFNRASYDSQGIDWHTALGEMASALGGDYDLSWVDWDEHNFQVDSFTAQFIDRLPPKR